MLRHWRCERRRGLLRFRQALALAKLVAPALPKSPSNVIGKQSSDAPGTQALPHAQGPCWDLLRGANHCNSTTQPRCHKPGCNLRQWLPTRTPRTCTCSVWHAHAGIVDQSGSCCPQGSSLDAQGGCCSSPLDACGTCGGKATAVDFTGGCCVGVLDAGGLCCSRALDEFGVCGGVAATGALALTIDAVVAAGAQGAAPLQAYASCAGDTICMRGLDAGTFGMVPPRGPMEWRHCRILACSRGHASAGAPAPSLRGP